jgi:hypothetical protein
MSPEPMDEKPTAKPEIRGGDKFEDVLDDVQYNDLGLYLDEEACDDDGFK